ncbi:glycosyltransferase family 2 protein [Metabacillus indicus]|uniref:glycosyltransferase family 2 protein n=1 Tax=Metabacillus indicus TaxID=246786 RepID=UPI00068BBF75|nr:glycosyltransferase family A protein [Metabacillus indicus]
MKVSVIIPTHKRAKALFEALTSINRQTIKPHEVIVINDGGDRKTIQMLERFKPDSYALHLKEQVPAKGACTARNLGAALSSGDILMFLDDDDTWEPEKIEQQLITFKQSADIGLVYSGKLVVKDTNRNKITRVILPQKRGRLYPDIFFDNLIGTTSSVSIKKELFEKTGGFDVNLPAMQDYDLWIRCCKHAVIEHDRGCYVRYTIADDPNHQISGNSDHHKRAVSYLFEKYEKELTVLGPDVKRRFCSSRYMHLSKAVHRKSYGESLKYSVKSFLYYPNLRAAALFLHPKTLNLLNKFVYKTMKPL